MDGKYKIRTVAMCIARTVYCNMDDNLAVNDFDISFAYNPSTPNVTVSQNDIMIALHYLKQKGFMQFSMVGSKIISGKLTALGIDWIEDTYKITYNIF